MQDHHFWLIAALALGIAEMLSGTFFLLVLAIAALAGAATAWFGGSFWLQTCIASILAVIGVFLVQHYRHRAPSRSLPSFDLGQPVGFEQWVSQAEGMARVNYRGTTWEARVTSGQDPAPGTILYIQAVEGNRLLVSDLKP